MSDNDWYDVAQARDLLQGDILRGCPVVTHDQDLPWPVPADFQTALRVRVLDLVVMTQSCDLANDKVSDVLLAQVVSYKVLIQREAQRQNTAPQSSKFRKLLVEGQLPSFALLHKRELEPQLPWSVVDFHHLHTIPKTFLLSFIGSLGPRLRLRSPYREHLAQAFARYFLRVGLPHDARSFEKEGGTH